MLSLREKLDKAAELKAEGNELFKSGSLAKAASTYRTVFAYVNGLVAATDGMAQYAKSDDMLSEEQAAEVKVIKTTVYSNLAAVYLKMDRLDKALDAADKAIALDEAFTKAHFRRGQALLRLRRFEPAKKSLMTAARQTPQDKTIRAELERFKTEYSAWKTEQDAKQKALYAGTM